MKDYRKIIGQTVLVRIPGYTLPKNIRKAFEVGHIGGVVLFSDNVYSQNQLFNLISDIYSASYHYPLIACDQEGGAVDRFCKIITPIPSAMSLAATNDTELFTKVIKSSLSQLKQLGINCILAPVLDVVNSIINPIIATRAYSDDVSTIIKFAQIYLEIADELGILAVTKHFPGHGSTVEDSHLDLAINPNNINLLKNIDLKPYNDLVGLIKSVMMAHVYTPSIEPYKIPASLAQNAYNYLFNTLNFKGLVFTDDMAMLAIKKYYGLNEATLKAFLAGADYLMLCDDFALVSNTIDYLNENISQDKNLQLRLEQTVNKIKLYNINKPDLKRNLIDSNTLNNDFKQNLEAAKAGLCLISGHLPDLNTIDYIFHPKHFRYDFDLPLAIKNHKTYQFKSKPYNYKPTLAVISNLAKLSKDKNIILVLYRPVINTTQFDLLKLLESNSQNIYLIIIDLPYGIKNLTNVKMILACLDPGSLGLEALASSLVYKQNPTGKLPLEI